MKNIIANESANVLCLQETKTVAFSEARCFLLWGIVMWDDYIMKV